MVLDGWMDEWMDVKAVLRIAYSNKKRIVKTSFKNIVKDVLI